MDPLLSCDWSCPGECKKFYEGLEYLKSICLRGRYDEFDNIIRELEHKLAHEYWSRLKWDIVRCGLSPGEGFFLSMVIENNPYLLWREIGYIPFNGVRNPPAVDYILDQIITEDGEREAMDALGYVHLLDRLQKSIQYVHDDEVYAMLRVFYRRYSEAFGAPYPRG
jgi:hypothetical protein